jgi:SAM-dependent methyltransferase
MCSRIDILWAVRAEVRKLTNVGDLVVDPMCGSGVILEVALKEGRKVLGFDVSPLMVAYANRLLDWRVGLADARRLPRDLRCHMILSSFPGHMTVAYSNEKAAIEMQDRKKYLKSMQEVMSEMKRVLLPGGMCVLAQSPAQTEIMRGVCLMVGLPVRFVLVPGAV